MSASTPVVEAFVARARAALPHENIGRYKTRTYSSSRAVGDAIIGLILSGEKTGTFSLAAEFDGQPDKVPQVGDYYVITNFDGEPALLYRVTAIEQVPFTAINDEHVQVEGPAARTVAVWRKIHWDYWGAILRAQGREPSETMPVIFQRFELLFPRDR